MPLVRLYKSTTNLHDAVKHHLLDTYNTALTSHCGDTSHKPSLQHLCCLFFAIINDQIMFCYNSYFCLVAVLITRSYF